MGDKPQQQLPPWERDPLSSFLKDAALNEHISSLNLAPIYSLLKQTHSVFESVKSCIEKDNHEELLVPRLLLVRSYSAFLAAVRLSMSGQSLEAMPVLRAAIEQTWYSLHIARDPKPPERSFIWLQRHTSPLQTKMCKNEFTIANVSATHKSLDAPTEEKFHILYNDVIDYGAHPNEKGILASMKLEETADAVTYQVGILYPDPLLVTVTLKTAIEVAIGILKVSQLICPMQLKVAGLDICIEQLIREVPPTFADSGK